MVFTVYALTWLKSIVEVVRKYLGTRIFLYKPVTYDAVGYNHKTHLLDSHFPFILPRVLVSVRH